MSQLCPADAAFGAREGEREEWRKSRAPEADAAAAAAAAGTGGESRKLPPDFPLGIKGKKGGEYGKPRSC